MSCNELIYFTCNNCMSLRGLVSHRFLAEDIILYLLKYINKIKFSYQDKIEKKKNIQRKYKKYLIFPIKYIKHYKSTQYMKRTTLSTNMIGNEKQKTWQKNTIYKGKMLKVLCPC